MRLGARKASETVIATERTLRRSRMAIFLRVHQKSLSCNFFAFGWSISCYCIRTLHSDKRIFCSDRSDRVGVTAEKGFHIMDDYGISATDPADGMLSAAPTKTPEAPCRSRTLRARNAVAAGRQAIFPLTKSKIRIKYRSLRSQ